MRTQQLIRASMPMPILLVACLNDLFLDEDKVLWRDLASLPEETETMVAKEVRLLVMLSTMFEKFRKSLVGSAHQHWTLFIRCLGLHNQEVTAIESCDEELKRLSPNVLGAILLGDVMLISLRG